MSIWPDKYFLFVTFIPTLTLQATFYLVALVRKNEAFTDISAAINVLVLVVLTRYLGENRIQASPFPTPTATRVRGFLATFALGIWALRLGGFLMYRVHNSENKRDTRFEEIRKSKLRLAGFWIFQLFWVWIISTPVSVVNSLGGTDQPSTVLESLAYPNATDILGILFFVVGLVFESVADVQRFRSRCMYGASRVCNDGLWKYSRHPNYFGEIILQCGIFLTAVSPKPSLAQVLLSLPAPILTFLLLYFVSGMNIQEVALVNRQFKLASSSPTSKRWKNYSEYVHSVSPLVPFPTSLYTKFPDWVKQVFFLDRWLNLSAHTPQVVNPNVSKIR